MGSNPFTGTAPQASFSTQPTILPDQAQLLAELTNNPAAATNQFAASILQPSTTNFNEQVLPGIVGQYGRDAGGAYGSGSAQARQQAGTSLVTGQNAALISLLQTLFGGSTATTQGTTGVGVAGSPGIAQGLLGSPALGSAVSGLFGLL